MLSGQDKTLCPVRYERKTMRSVHTEFVPIKTHYSGNPPSTCLFKNSVICIIGVAFVCDKMATTIVSRACRRRYERQVQVSNSFTGCFS